MKDRIPELQQLFARAIELHDDGDPAAALPLYQQVARTLPDADIVQYNLGLALYELGHFEQAAEAFEAALKTNPLDADTWCNLGLASKQAGNTEQAEQAYLKALELRPEDCDILHNLGLAYKADGCIAKAVAVYEQLLRINDQYRPGISNLAYFYHLQGEFERAMRLYRRLLEFNPDDERTQFMLRILEGEDVAVPPPGYIRELFDQYSSHFDQSLLDKLDYQVPELVDRLLARRTERKRPFKRVLDLGCGTGLAGEKLKPYAECLEGVDLSQGMLNLAKEKGLYHSLVLAEAVAYLQAAANSQWDLIVATDVLIYLGDLSPLFAAIASRLPAQGLFCFTTELTVEEASWSLHPNGRYGHSREYISALADINGFRIVSSEKINKRKEAGEWIKGVLWLLEKNRGNHS